MAGEVVVPLDLEAVRRAGRELLDEGCTAPAVCFLWSFRNDEHEQAAKHLAPETDRYLERVGSTLEALRDEVLIIQCTGSVNPLSRAGSAAAS